ncbi:hypothetical protein EJ04DRAFT_570152 [Polyplosphaeria fusca]|uniref:Uncharacterized protein n=1 Tax=Polyplosphaeria fusca TaxID=682080 RepID=A0A9P4QMX4_9PLEO|nr:hypothetical protein EJ04DRAFT_570152 [Polyplosphaeria fusca]
MRFTSAIAILSAVAGLGTAFKLETFSDDSCNDKNQNVNVWDNTCADWPSGFKSYKITTWGGNRQYAYFFGPDNCGSLPGAIIGGYVDRTTKDYELDTCYTLGGASANAIASYWN